MVASLSRTLETALRHHQTGDLAQAERLYRQCLQEQPDRADAWHLFGLLAHQVGAAESAIAAIARAIELDDRQPIYHNSLGEAYRGAGQLDRAIAAYRRALHLHSDYFEARYNLANALRATGNLDGAIAAYRQAAKLRADVPALWNNLGIACKQRGDLDGAIAAYRQAIALDDRYLTARLNLGNALQALDRLDAAIAAYRDAIAIQSDCEEAYNHLGTALQRLGDMTGAIEAYQYAVALKADYAEAYFNLGSVLQATGDREQAIAAFGRAALIRHDWQEPRLARAHLLRDTGRTADADTQYRSLLQQFPDCAIAAWNAHLLLPVLYDTPEEITPWRSRFARGLQHLEASLHLDAPAQRHQALQAALSATNFYLQYQGQNDTALQQQYGRVLHRVVTANYPQWADLPSPPPQRDRLRVGFVSHVFRDHTVARLFGGWVQHLDRARFEPICYYTGAGRDRITEGFAIVSAAFHHIPGNLEAMAAQIARDRPDVLIYLDIGMEPLVAALAALRLAPLQCATWGHPITTGLPTIDAFLSSDGMEPPDAASHYSETLVRLPHLGIAFARPALPAGSKSRADFGLGEERTVYLCAQSAFKYLPQYDGIFPAIARAVPNAQFAFLASPTGRHVTERWRDRLHRAFAACGLDGDRYCVILPRLSHDEYLHLNYLSDLYLDTIDWSGGHTTLEAIACGLPVITLPGAFLRGRHAYAMLNRLDLEATIARDLPHYITLAAQWGRDRLAREGLKAELQSRSATLFDDLTPVRALEGFLLSAAGV